MTAPKRPTKNPMTSGFPISIPLDEALNNIARADARAAARVAARKKPNLGRLAPDSGAITLEPIVTKVADTTITDASRPTTKAERDHAAFRASYLVGDTTPTKVDLSQDLPGRMRLEVTQIEGYDHNPRLYENEATDEIRASLIANGFHGSMLVTRRHVGAPYMLAAGANTTLRLLRELYDATGDERYRWVDCNYQPFKGETALLSQHLGENLNRGDMKFWEIASGMCELLRLIEAERQAANPGVKELSGRDAADELTKRGLKADRTTVRNWRFAVTRLTGLGEARRLLSLRDVKNLLQPRIGELQVLAQRFSIPEDQFFDRVVNPVFKGAEAAVKAASITELDPAGLCASIESALASHLSESPDTIRTMLASLRANPYATLAELRQPSPNLIAGGKTAGSVSSEPEDDRQGGSGSTASEPGMPGPLRSNQQAPLGLPPGLIRNEVANPAPGGPTQRTSVTTTTNAPAGTPRGSVGPLFDPHASDEPDPLGALLSAVDQLLSMAGLSDTLRWQDSMPLGFYLDLPDPEIHRKRTVAIDSPGDRARSIKTMVWWTLTGMACQWLDGIEKHIDRSSRFYTTYAVEREESPLEGLDIETQPMEPEIQMMMRYLPGLAQPVMRQLRLVEELASHALERLPERMGLIQRLINANAGAFAL